MRRKQEVGHSIDPGFEGLVTDKTRPDCRFKVTYNDISELQQNRMEDIPAWRKLYETYPKEIFIEMFSAFGLAMALGDVNFDQAQSLNVKYPDIKTTKLRDIISKYWTGR